MTATMNKYALTVTAINMTSGEAAAAAQTHTMGTFRTKREATAAMETAARRLWDSYSEGVPATFPNGCFINNSHHANVILPISVTHFNVIKQ